MHLIRETIVLRSLSLARSVAKKKQAPEEKADRSVDGSHKRKFVMRL
jgi:hypothetical protein